MFTLGIFTTHLPYIALVVFYAFFWMFGVNKATAGEISSGENNISIELPSSESINSAAFDYCYSVNDTVDTGFLPPTNPEVASSLQRKIPKGFYFDKCPEVSFFAVLFSRPPPILI